VLARIAVAEAQGNSMWASFNRQNLDLRIRPALAMLCEGQTYAKGDRDDREYTPQEWEQQHAHPQQEEGA
jgi:hypothetical protein